MKNVVFLSQKVDRNMTFTDYWKVLLLTFSEMEIRSFFQPKSWWKNDIYWLLKVLVLNFSETENTVFFESRSWWKDDNYWLLKSSCFKLFSDGEYGLFFSQKVDGKMIITWFLWAFHDITGFGKYGFSCSVSYQQTCYSMIKKVSPHRFLFFFLCRAEATSTSFLKLCKFRKYYGKVIFVPTSCVEKAFFCSQKFIPSSFPSS